MTSGMTFAGCLRSHGMTYTMSLITQEDWRGTHLCRVLDDAGELDSHVLSVSRANISPLGVLGREESRLVVVDVDGGAELSGEDDGRGRWAAEAADDGEARGDEPLMDGRGVALAHPYRSRCLISPA